jgi:hypothetical protein
MLSNTNVFFFWVDAGSKNVSCSAVSGGLTNSNTVAFTVVRPIATVSTTRGGVSMGYAYSNLYMNFGLATGQPGILFSNTIIMPPGFSNIMYYTEWVQIITSWISILTISNSVTNIINYTNQTPGLLALDSAYPYNDIITNVFVYPITSDSPAIPLAFNNQIAASKSQYSQMAVMFKPFNTNNNWVCLWIVNWNCNGTANGFGPNPSHWTLSGTNISVSASADSGGTYLTWTNNVESFKTNYPTR